MRPSPRRNRTIPPALACLALAFLAAPGAGAQGKPLGLQIPGNGTILMVEDCREILRIEPRVFPISSRRGLVTGDPSRPASQDFLATGGWDPGKGAEAVLVVGGVRVFLNWKEKRSGSRIHVSYVFRPQGTLEVYGVHAALTMPYAEWEGARFEMNGKSGAVPSAHSLVPNQWTLREEKDLRELLLGPGPAGLRLDLGTSGVGGYLYDARDTSPTFHVFLHHNEGSAAPWVWENGTEKKFEFTVQLNRNFLSQEDFEATCTPGAKKDQPPFPSRREAVPTDTPPPLPPTATPVPSRATPTPTPGDFGIPTPTPVPEPCPPRVLDDFEDPKRSGKAPARWNLWNGSWSAQQSPGSSMAFEWVPGAHGSKGALRVQGKASWPQGRGAAILRTTLSRDGSPRNLSTAGLNVLHFRMKGDGNSYWVNLRSAGLPDAYGYSYQVTPRRGVWAVYRIPFRQMNRRSWWETRGGESEYPDGRDLTTVEFLSQNEGNFSFEVDDLSFHCDPRYPIPTPRPEPPTATPTWTAAPRLTPTATWTSTRVPAKATPTWTGIPTATWTALVPTSTWTPIPQVIHRPEKPVPTPTYAWPKLPTPVRALRVPPTSTVALPKLPPPLPVQRAATPTPVPARPAPAARPPAAIAPPKPIPGWFPPPSPIQPVTIRESAASISLSFSDGPGNYQVKIADEEGNILKTIFDRDMEGREATWCYWDGKDGGGKSTGVGRYYILVYKDGKALYRVTLIRTA